MADGIVGWHFFDAESGLVPEEFSPALLPSGGKGRVVVLAATPFARADGWASRAVVAIARGWAGETLRIFLMDLGVDAPSLHQALGLLNREGVSDAFLYGASVQRIAQPALDGAIFFASAGTATTDPAQILGHPRWTDLAGGFSEADATLLLFLPTAISGADKILSRATDVFFLAGQGESPESHLGPASIKVVAMMGPMGSPTDAGSGSTEGGDVLGEKWMSGPVESPPTLDLDRTLSLAEGFIAEARRTDFEEEDPEVEPSLGEGMEGESPQDGGLTMEDSDSLIQGLGVEEGIFKDSMGESIRADGEAAGRGKLVQEAPDFEAEFADLPDVGGGADASGESLMLGGEPPEEPELGSDLPRQSLSDFRPQPDPFGDSGAEDSEKAHLPPPVGGKRSFPDRPRPMSKRRPPPKKGLSRWRMGAVAGALLVAVAAVGTGAGFFNIPGFGFLQGWFGEIPDPELALEGVAQTGPVLRFSLELDVYEEGDLGLALEMRNTLRQRLPSLLFDLTPRFSEGTVTYALYAGPAVDVVDAENLRVPLGTVLTREDPESWPVRVTPRAFWLGESGSLEEARTLLEAAEADGVLGYILQVTYPDGTEGFEVLSGAFQGVPDARGWQLTLREKGFRDAPLIERRGRPPE